MLIHEFTATSGSAGGWLGLPAGIFPAHGSYRVPTRAECGLAEVQQYAEELHHLGHALRAALAGEEVDSNAFARDFGGQDLSRWLEIAEIIRSAGAATILALASLCEIEGLLNGSDHELPSISPLVAGFVTEATAQYLISVGHDLANASWRICLTSSACQTQFAAGGSGVQKLVSASIPRSTSRQAWIFHSEATNLADLLATSRVPPARLMRATARLYVAADWQGVIAARDRHFHQLRSDMADGSARAFHSASDFHLACMKAARCLGRAIPAVYHGVVDSIPLLSGGRRRGVPLITAPQVVMCDPSVQGLSSPRAAVPRRRFRG